MPGGGGGGGSSSSSCCFGACPAISNSFDWTSLVFCFLRKFFFAGGGPGGGPGAFLLPVEPRYPELPVAPDLGGNPIGACGIAKNGLSGIGASGSGI